MKDYVVRPPLPPVLGYQGVSLKAPGNRIWFAYSGVVTLSEIPTRIAREDAGRTFEKTLLESAPEGSLPADVPTLFEF